MKINSSIFDPLRPDRNSTVDPARGKSADAHKPAATTSSQPRSDTVQISDSGRSMAARASAEKPSEMDPAHVADLRRKVYEGAYNSLDVVDQVARRVLARGDL
jgi:negative regulator of flagellin synthesis FlgM